MACPSWQNELSGRSRTPDPGRLALESKLFPTALHSIPVFWVVHCWSPDFLSSRSVFISSHSTASQLVIHLEPGSCFNDTTRSTEISLTKTRGYSRNTELQKLSRPIHPSPFPITPLFKHQMLAFFCLRNKTKGFLLSSLSHFSTYLAAGSSCPTVCSLGTRLS